MGIYHFNARFYSPTLGRFLSADTIVPGYANPQNLNRYSYGLNNPSRYTDSTGHAAECGIYAGTSCGGVGPQQPTLVQDQMGISVSQHFDIPQEDVINGVNNAWEFTTTVYSFIFEPIDWVVSGAYCIQGECNPWMLAGLLPFIPGSTGNRIDDIIDASKAIDNTVGTGVGFSSFRQLKEFLGDAGDGMEWHHIVEQSQIRKSGFSPQQIHNAENVLAVDAVTHRKISGFYSSKPRFAGGLTVRNWLAGKRFDYQHDYGLKILRGFGVIP